MATPANKPDAHTSDTSSAKKLTAKELEQWTLEATNDAQWLARLRVALKRAQRGAYKPSNALATLLEEYEAILYMRKLVKPGDTLSTVLRHCSRSGMMRHIDVYLFRGSGEIYLSHYAALLSGYPRHSSGAVAAGGCGMDMGFAIVSNMSSALFRYGFKCIGRTEKKRCPSNDHSNGAPYVKGDLHLSGGYALEQSWL